METIRKLATIQKIRDIRPIEGADAIELAIINDWQVVVAKNVGHQIGDWIIYCEIDSFLPIRDEFEFLRKSSFKRMGDQEGFRLKTIKLRGQISQGLVIPISILVDNWGEVECVEGFDVTSILGIVKYEPTISPQLAGVAKGNFPSFIRKTDEERVQNLTSKYDTWRNSTDHTFYVTEKLDGSSATYYVKDGEFGVCSRNLELSDPDEAIIDDNGEERTRKDNAYWKAAREMDIKKKLLSLNRNICIQGELIGEGIQKNPYNIKGHTVKFYNAFDIDTQEKLSFDAFVDLISELGFETVPVLSVGTTLPDTIEHLLQVAEGKSVLNQSVEREGIVIRSTDMSISFKAISNRFLLKQAD